MAVCAAKFLAEGAAETAASGGVLGPVIAVGGVAMTTGVGFAFLKLVGMGGSAAAAGTAVPAASSAAVAEAAFATAGIAGRVAIGTVLGVSLGTLAATSLVAFLIYKYASTSEGGSNGGAVAGAAVVPVPSSALQHRTPSSSVSFPSDIRVAASSLEGAEGNVLNIDNGMVTVDFGSKIGVRQVAADSLTVVPRDPLQDARSFF